MCGVAVRIGFDPKIHITTKNNKEFACPSFLQSAGLVLWRKQYHHLDLTVRLKTFIVEDNPTIRDNLIATLEELAGVEVAGTAETENAARAWLNDSANTWSLAIVDLFLKQGSGLGVLSTCRNRAPTQKMVVLSNYATADIRQRCGQLGVDAVFDKSNEIDALVDYCIQQSVSGN